ncbi:hypothetical protein Tco_1392814 [Tanacetum coccineum]
MAINTTHCKKVNNRPKKEKEMMGNSRQRLIEYQSFNAKQLEKLRATVRISCFQDKYSDKEGLPLLPITRSTLLTQLDLLFVNMAATLQNIKLEAAKLLRKLIHESTDKTTKLATELHVCKFVNARKSGRIFFGKLMKGVTEKQKELQMRFLDTLERWEKE